MMKRIGLAVMAWLLYFPLQAQTLKKVEVELQDAVFSAEDGPRSLLQASVDFKDGTWGWVMGRTPNMNRAIHRGRILSGSLEQGELRLEMECQRDPWVKGGLGIYDVSVQPSEDGYEGAYTGTYRGQPVSGVVQVRLSNPLPLDEGFVPLVVGEHPRLLFRKQDVPALRRKAETPFGKAMVQQISKQGDVVSLGLLYQLTGDEGYAMRAKPLVEEKLKDHNPGAFNGADGHYARQVASVALAFDLCQDAWSEEFRQEVIAYFAQRTQKMLFRPHSITRKMNWSLNSNYSGHMNGASALVGLLLMDKPGTAPGKPEDPGSEPHVLSPSWEPGEGERLPVWEMEPGKMPPTSYWRISDVVEDEQNVYPLPDTVRLGDVSGFRELKEEMVWQGQLELMRTTGKQFDSTLFFSSVIKVTAPGVYRFSPQNNGGNTTDVYLGGTHVDPGAYVHLEEGVYSLVMRAHLWRINPWGAAAIQPRFEVADPERMAEEFAQRQQQYRLNLARYAEDVAFWKETGGNPWYRWLALCSFEKVTGYHRYTFGNGGFQTEGEGYTQVGSPEPVLFESAYRRSLGHASTGRPDVTHFAARHVAQTVTREQGSAQMQSFSLTSAPLPMAHIPAAFVATEDSMKPSVLWYWNRRLGLPDSTQPFSERADAAVLADTLRQNSENAVKTFLFYPLEMSPLSPENRLPRVWKAETKGLMIFRNQWKDESDIVAQMFAKSEGEGGHQAADAGSFRLIGLGHEWASLGPARAGNGKAPLRHSQTVVLFPDLEHNRNTRGIWTDSEARENGSGWLAVNLDYLMQSQRTELVTATRKVKKEGKQVKETYQTERKLRLVDYAFQFQPDHLEDNGMRATRFLSVDYSGRSGVPAVFVLEDQIQGETERLWAWQLPKKVSADQIDWLENGFAIQQGDAELQVRFFEPVRVELGFLKADGTFIGPDQPGPAIGVRSLERPEQGSFLAVLSLGKTGQQPEVQPTRKGLKIGGVNWIRSDSAAALFPETR